MIHTLSVFLVMTVVFAYNQKESPVFFYYTILS